MNPFWVLAILVTFILFGFLMREYAKLKMAHLIIENKILYIQPAIITDCKSVKTGTTPNIGGIDVFVSCFGILLDSKVIKYNLDGIHLKAVEIGHKFIFLTYGTDRQAQKAQILHEDFDHKELQSIIERFSHETGIVPVITD